MSPFPWKDFSDQSQCILHPCCWSTVYIYHHGICKTFTWLLFSLWIFPFWASLVHHSAPEYYLSKWKCYCLNYDTTIIRWCISLFNFMWYMLWQKTHNMKSTLLAKFFSVQYSTVNCKHNVLHHISRTFSLCIMEFLYLKKFCEENNVWVRMYEHNFGWVRFFNFFFPLEKSLL